MTESSFQSIDLVDEFIHLDADGSAFAFEPSGSFWAGTDPTEAGRSLGAVAFRCSDDLHHRYDERHGGSDEVIIVGDGELEVWLDLPAGEQIVTVESGHAVVVPADTWHRLIAKQPGWLIFCNRRSGIESRPHQPKGPT